MTMFDLVMRVSIVYVDLYLLNAITFHYVKI